MTTNATLVPAVAELLETARGRRHRHEPVTARTGGPAGNAQLTAWLGLLLLALFVGELITLVDVTGLLTWHIALGLILIPPSLAKTATTGWRILRYYTGSAPYTEAGPPPLLLRLLGPLVIAGTLAVLGSGVLLIALGPANTFRPWFTVAGQGVSALTVHQGSFVLWGATTGLHVLARLVPAMQRAGTRGGRGDAPGVGLRAVTMGLIAAAAVGVAVVLFGYSGSWTSAGL